jgi:hypothetical protein
MSDGKPIARKKQCGVDAILVWESNPIPIIKRALEKSDWFQAVVFSAIRLERFGYFTIKEHLESLKISPDKEIIKNFLVHLYLPQIALFLLGIQKIDTKEYKTMIKINDERNKFIHHREVKQFAHGQQAQTKYKPLVNEVMRILSEKLDAEEKRLP